jgi:hypothetical protein
MARGSWRLSVVSRQSFPFFEVGFQAFDGMAPLMISGMDLIEVEMDILRFEI